MKKKFLFRALALLVLLVCAVGANAESVKFSSYGIYYQLTTYSDGSGVVTVQNNGSFNTYSGVVNIPDSVQYSGVWYPVTGIGYQAFKGCTGLTAVTIPEGVTMLLNEAFAGCTSLTSITLPSTMYSIYNNAFTGCTSLSQVYCLRADALSCNANNFDASTYANASLFVPEGSLSSYQSTSPWSQFSEIEEINKFVVDGIYYRKTGTNTACVTYRDTYFNSYDGNIYIPPTVTYKGVTYTVTEIGPSAFRECRPNDLLGLYVIVPNTVTDISSYAFYNSKLNYIELGTGVRTIGGNAFTGTDNSLYVLFCHRRTPATIIDDTFSSGVFNNTRLWVPRDAASAYQSASYWSNFKTDNIYGAYDFAVDNNFYRITGPNSVEVTAYSMSLDSTYFYYAIDYERESVNIPATVTYEGTTYNVNKIGYAAFAWWKMKNASLPDGITEIEPLACYSCDSLENINFPKGLTKIGYLAFYDCARIQSVDLPNSVKTIDELAFWRCFGIKTLTLGSGVELIGYDAFSSCDSITSVTCHALVPPAVTYPPDNYEVLFATRTFYTATLYVPESSSDAYKSARAWEDFYHVETFISLDEALNVPGGTLRFDSYGDYPWQGVTDGDRVYAQSSNAGVPLSTSTLSTTVTLANKTTLSFDFKAWGEGTNTFWDVCVFAIDGVDQLRLGAYDNTEWETFSVEIPAGSHTLTWSYSKDSNIDKPGDYFAIDNVSLGKRGDVNNNGVVDINDVTALIGYVLTGNATGINLANADVTGNGEVDINDVTALIQYVLTGAFPS